MDESILSTVKVMCGIVDDYNAFDAQLIMDINAVFLILYQRGIGPKQIFSISDKSAVWSDFLDDDRVSAIKPYVGYRVRLMFDTPSNSSVKDAIQDIVNELEWRLSIEFDDTYIKDDISSNED